LENRVLRKIFGPNREEVTRDRRQLHNEKLNDLYYSPNIIRAIKSRRMRLVGHVARTVKRRSAYRVLWGNLRERDHLESSGLDGRVKINWIFKNLDRGHRLNRPGSG
jgi:hypothetical protein